MSTGATQDLVEVPVAPSRDPAAYRPTVHFGQRLKDRVPEHDRDALPRRLIEEGAVSRVQDHPHATDSRGALVAFIDVVAGETWTLIVSLRPCAFTREGKHGAVSIYRGRPGDDPDSDETPREVTV